MLFALIVYALILIFPNKIQAINEFKLKQSINYNIDTTGKAQITNQIELINMMPDIYPTEYQLSINGSNISNIVGNDNYGNIIQSIETKEDFVVINIKFNNATVGKNKSTNFQIKYNINDFAKHKGNIWEINIPEYKTTNNEDEINIDLFVPSSFGRLSFASTTLPNISPFNKLYHLNFSTQQLLNKKILLIFGNYQLFDFNLKYYLKNQSSNPTTTKIAIPPNLPSQKITFKNIDPTPINITIDKDGNWLAEYLLAANQTTKVEISGQAKILNSQYPDKTPSNDLLLESKFWPVNDQNIKEIASKLNTPKDIYQYVVDTLSYDFTLSNPVRKGALEALLNPENSLCTEFTDLFVTLARTKGIPAREIEGYAYTNNPKIKPVGTNTDILHAWPQYYDKNKQSWISIDPTWGKTTNGIDYFNDLDLNHFILVIHGLDSENPPPPGSYRNNDNTKTVEINFANKEFLQNLNPPIIEIKKNNVIVSNKSPGTLTQIQISAPQLNFFKEIPILGPYSHLNFELPKLPFIKTLSPKYKEITVSTIYQDAPNAIKVSSKYPAHYRNLLFTSAFLVILLSLGGIIITRHEKIS
jgi:hypothetical protein